MKRYNYQHIERINFSNPNKELEGLFRGTVHVFPKIDGMNVSIRLNDSKTDLIYGGRNKDFNPLENNDRSLISYFENNLPRKAKLMRLLTSFDGEAIIFGEWLVPHTIKYYKEDAWKNFYIFDIVLFKSMGVSSTNEKEYIFDRYVKFEEYKKIIDSINDEVTSTNLLYIPEIATLKDVDFKNLENVIETKVDTNYVYLTDSGLKGEGIIFKNYDYKNPYGRTTWGKIVFSEFKNVKAKHIDTTKNLKEEDDKNFEYLLLKKYLTVEFLSKEIKKFEDFKGKPFEMKEFGNLLNYTFEEFIKDYILDIIKDLRKEAISFGKMKNLFAIFLKEKLGY